MQHIQTVLKQYDIGVEKNHKITLNYNATNSNDIHEQDIESVDETNFLNTESDTAELTMTDDNQTQFDSQETDIMQDEYSQYILNTVDILRSQLTLTLFMI